MSKANRHTGTSGKTNGSKSTTSSKATNDRSKFIFI